jgi:hypothetical protein
MDTKPPYHRPPFETVLEAWKKLLAERGLPTQMIWVFDENLCFESDPKATGGFKLGIQTAFTMPPPPKAERAAYEYFAEYNARLVFYRVGTFDDKSCCLVLCDSWFENKQESDGFVRRDEWRVSFRPGERESVEEIKDEGRWNKRIVRGRPLHDLDFCLALRSVHELYAHGRVLTPYERYALRFLHVWKRFLGPQHGPR